MYIVLTTIITMIVAYVLFRLLRPIPFMIRDFRKANKLIENLNKTIREQSVKELKTSLMTKVFDMTGELETPSHDSKVYCLLLIVNGVSYNFVLRCGLLTQQLSYHYRSSFIFIKDDPEIVSESITTYVFRRLIENSKLGSFIDNLIDMRSNYDIGTDESVIEYYNSIGWDIRD